MPASHCTQHQPALQYHITQVPAYCSASSAHWFLLTAQVITYLSHLQEKNISAVAVVNAQGAIIGNFSISELR